MAKSVDARDLKSLSERSVGSSPTGGITYLSLKDMMMGRISVHLEKNLEARLRKSKRRAKTIRQLKKHIQRTEDKLFEAAGFGTNKLTPRNMKWYAVIKILTDSREWPKQNFK